jgi:hypothetical protein
VPALLAPVLAFSAHAAAAAQASSTTTCALGNVTIQDDGGTSQPGAIQLVAQDSTVGLKHQISPYHLNATRVFGTLTPGTKSPVVSTFTQADPQYGSSGSLQITNEAMVKTVCLGQFKSVIPGGRVFTTGFAFPSVRNNLVIQNSATNPLTSVDIQVNTLCQLSVPLTPGELYSLDMSNVAGVNCLFSDTSGSTTLNSATMTAQGPTGAIAEGVIWGVGPFVYQPLPI